MQIVKSFFATFAAGADSVARYFVQNCSCASQSSLIRFNCYYALKVRLVVTIIKTSPAAFSYKIALFIQLIVKNSVKPELSSNSL